jgi:hypothetical protein
MLFSSLTDEQVCTQLLKYLISESLLLEYCTPHPALCSTAQAKMKRALLNNKITLDNQRTVNRLLHSCITKSKSIILPPLPAVSRALAGVILADRDDDDVALDGLTSAENLSPVFVAATKLRGLSGRGSVMKRTFSLRSNSLHMHKAKDSQAPSTDLRTLAQ